MSTLLMVCVIGVVVTALAAYGAGSSFSLYVIHFPLLALIAAAIGLHERLRPTSAAIGGCIVLCAFLTLAAWGFSQLTERHTRRVRQWVAGFVSDLARSGRPRTSEIG